MKVRLTYVSHILSACVALTLVFGVEVAQAQTGKITGVVTDAQTGEALSGVQVFLEGTGRGALSADNGRYFLVNVPVGTYTVVAEFLGYATVRIEGVFLTIDQTRNVNFQLEPQAIAVEEIRVEAERVPLIDVSSTGSESTITAAQITALPVNNVEEALQLQQGFLKVPDQTNLLSFSETRRNSLTPIRIRGGRGAETVMLIDGVPVNNFLFGSPALSITPEAIQQIDFVRGGFPPQYGNALSGIINIATKEGSGSDLEGAVNYRTAEIGNALGNGADEVSNYDLFEAYVAGPVPGTEWGAEQSRLRFMLAGRQQAGIDGSGAGTPRALEFDNDVYDPTARPDANIYPFLGPNFMDVWPGWRGLGFDRERDMFGKLSYYFTPTAKLNFTFIDYQRERKPFDFVFLPNYGNPLDSPIIDTQADSVVFFMNRFASRLEPLQFPLVVEGSIDQNRRLYVGAWDHTVGRGAYRVTVGKFDQDRLTCNVFNGVCLRDAFADPNFTDDQFISPKAGTCEEHPTCGADAFYGGEDLETWVARGDVQWQATDHHNVSFGAYYEHHDVTMNEVQNVGTNEVNIYRLAYAGTPWNGAFYVQDQIEYDFVMVNLGVRVDVGKAGGLFFPNPLDPTNGTTATGSTDPNNPGFSPIIRRDGPCIAPEEWQNVRVRYFNGTRTVEERISADPTWTRDVCLEDANAITTAALLASSDDFEEAGTRSAVSPRIGVSFPVTANSNLFFNFGRFTQNPLLNNVYTNTGIGKDTTVTFAPADEGCPGFASTLPDGNCAATSSLEGTPTGVTLLVPGEGNPGVIGNPNLVTEKTTLYELGYLAELYDDYALSVVLFAKDQTGLQGIQTGGTSEGIQVFDAGVTYRSNTPQYNVIVNSDFQTVRGFEMSLRRRIVDYWGFDINYSFARAKTNAAPPEKEFEQQVGQNDPANLIEIPSEIDQPQRLSASLFFRVGDESPEIPLGEVLKNTALAVVGRYESGFPYTPILDAVGTAGTAQLNRNSGRGPSVWTVDLRASKGFWLGNVNYDLYLQVQNVFDHKNCEQVFESTGDCRVGTIDQSRRREGNQLSADGITSTLVDRPQYFGQRRSILGGVRISF